MLAALPSHHDDDDGRSARRAASGADPGHGRGTAPASGHHNRWRLAAEPVADALYHPRGVSVVRPAGTTLREVPGRPLDSARACAWGRIGGLNDEYFGSIFPASAWQVP